MNDGSNAIKAEILNQNESRDKIDTQEMSLNENNLGTSTMISKQPSPKNDPLHELNVV